jgi:hypothetical protein
MGKVFCRACSKEAFKTWEGWPVDLPSHLGSFKKPPPLPRLNNGGACPRCGGTSVVPANHIRYSAYGMGLPTFGLVICDPDKNPDDYAAFSEWGTPYAFTLPTPVKKRSVDYR